MSTLIRPSFLFSLADVAALAGVQRPVVSVWRSRSTGSQHPFPEPVAEQGDERFDSEQVVDWLEQTGRGNSSSPREDVAAFAFVNTIGAEDEVALALEGLTALLCLKVITGQALAPLSGEALVDLADEADPDDDLLFREVTALGDRLEPLARYADLLADAAYNPAAAFEKLMTSRFQGLANARASVALAGPVVSLVAALAVELARAAESEPPTFADPTKGGSDLLLELLRQPGLDGAPSFLTRTGDDSASRMARRRLRVHDTSREALPVAADGSFQLEPGVVSVAQLPSPGAPKMTDDEILDAIDNIAIQMDDSQRAVVVAPSSALVDARGSRGRDLRDELLRTGRARAVVRLPAGLLVTKPRQALGLWVLGPAHQDVAIEDRWTMVADLSNVRLDDAAAQDLVTDLVAAMGDRVTINAHAFRFARSIPTRSLLAQSGSLVASSAPAATPHTDSAEVALRIGQLSAALSEGTGEGATRLVPAVSPVVNPDGARGKVATLGQAVSKGAVRMISGNRIDHDDLGSIGAAVLGPDEVAAGSPSGARRIDPLTLAGYDTGRYTEPGDVVFTTSPRPAALVDRDGGSVVAFPARVLRIPAGRGSGLLADVLAADINGATAQAKSWRLWPIRLVPAEQVEPMSETMTRLADRRADLLEELARLDDLTRAVVDGVARGAVALMPETVPTPPKETDHATAQEEG